MRKNQSSPMAPARLGLGPMRPPVPLMVWQPMQTVARDLPMAGSPGCEASAWNFAYFASMAAASASVMTAGKSVVGATLAVPVSLPHESTANWRARPSGWEPADERRKGRRTLVLLVIALGRCCR